jgi:Xaa-Pro dipeptidase
MIHEGRLSRLRAELRRGGYSGALLLASGRHQMLAFAPSNYLAGFLPLGDAALLVPGQDGAPLSIHVAPVWDASRAAAAVAGGALVHGAEDLMRSVRADLSARTGVWAVDGAGRFPCGAVEQLLRPAAGAELRRADGLLESLAAAKDEAERAAVARAAHVADAGFQALLDAARPGVAEYDLVAEMDYAMRRLGAEDDFGLVASGSHLQAIRVASGRRLEAGDLIIGEITPLCEGYFAQLCRTVVLGEAPAELKRAYGLLQAAFDAALAAVRPGEPVGAVAEALNAVMIRAGYEKYARPPYMRVRGHGLGMGALSPGNVEEDNLRLLEAGMTLIVHPNQFLPETGYIMLGDTIEVTSTGARSLSAVERRIFEKSA